MEAASEEFGKFLAIAGKQTVATEWEKRQSVATEWEQPKNPELHHALPPSHLLNGSNLFVRPREEQPGLEETLRNLKAEGLAEKSEVLCNSKQCQSESLSGTPSYEALDGPGNLAHYDGLSPMNGCEGPRCSAEGFDKSHFGGRPSEAMASSDVLVEGHDVHPKKVDPNSHPRKVDPAFLCLTDDQKASSALCTDLYEEVICQLNFFILMHV